MVWRNDFGQAWPVEPASGHFQNVNPILAASAKHPSKGDSKRLFRAGEGLKIDEAHPLQSEGAVGPVENRIRGQARTFQHSQDPGGRPLGRVPEVPS